MVLFTCSAVPRERTASPGFLTEHKQSIQCGVDKSKAIKIEEGTQQSRRDGNNGQYSPAKADIRISCNP